MAYWGLCWLLRGSFDCFCCPCASVLRPPPPPPPLPIWYQPATQQRPGTRTPPPLPPEFALDGCPTAQQGDNRIPGLGLALAFGGAGEAPRDPPGLGLEEVKKDNAAGPGLGLEEVEKDDAAGPGLGLEVEKDNAAEPGLGLEEVEKDDAAGPGLGLEEVENDNAAGPGLGLEEVEKDDAAGPGLGLEEVENDNAAGPGLGLEEVEKDDAAGPGLGLAPQAPALHVCDSEVAGHGAPPSAAAVVAARARDLLPTPHVADHPLHEPHWSTTQSTGQRHTCAPPLAGSQAATS